MRNVFPQKMLPWCSLCLGLDLDTQILQPLLHNGWTGCFWLSKAVNGQLTCTGVWCCWRTCESRGNQDVRQACPPGQGPIPEGWDSGFIAYRHPSYFLQENSVHSFLMFRPTNASSQEGMTLVQGNLAPCFCFNGEWAAVVDATSL